MQRCLYQELCLRACMDVVRFIVLALNRLLANVAGLAQVRRDRVFAEQNSRPRERCCRGQVYSSIHFDKFVLSGSGLP